MPLLEREFAMASLVDYESTLQKVANLFQSNLRQEWICR